MPCSPELEVEEGKEAREEGERGNEKWGQRKWGEEWSNELQWWGGKNQEGRR
jgi:hypothetical protein